MPVVVQDGGERNSCDHTVLDMAERLSAHTHTYTPCSTFSWDRFSEMGGGIHSPHLKERP